MIKPKEAAVPGEGVRSNSMLSMFQRFLKDVLDLSFQLDAIDYHADNFVHADLDTETFERMQAERGESMLILMLRQVLNDLKRQQAGEAQQPEISLTELVVALMAPDRARHLKLMLGRQFEDLESKFAGLDGPDGSVLVTERDKAAMRVLKKQIAEGKKSIGVFYGAAHMKDMDQRVRAMGFEPVKSEWRTAWGHDAEGGGCHYQGGEEEGGREEGRVEIRRSKSEGNAKAENRTASSASSFL